MSEDWTGSDNLLALVTTALFFFCAFIDQVMHFFDYKLLERCLIITDVLYSSAEQVYSTVSHFISTNSIVSGNIAQIMWFMIE